MAMSRPIYLDYAAATPVDPVVQAAMVPYAAERFYNPSASYKAARAVRADVEAARASLAAWLGVKAGEIIFTAGATESVNLALDGIMQAWPQARLAVGATEHAAVLAAADRYDHDLIAVDGNGLIDEAALRAAVTDTTVLVSIGYGNGMIGSLQPLKRLGQTIADIRAQRRASGNNRPLYFHTDATQAAAYLDLSVNRLSVDLLTVSAQKIYGPKQVALLYCRAGLALTPIVRGGGQERGLRAGTENVAGLIGFATAAALVKADRADRSRQVEAIRQAFEARLSRAFGDDILIIQPKQRLPHISHLSFAGLDAEMLLYMLDEQAIMVATGAACAANKQTESPTLLAIGLSPAHRQGSLRCSFSHLLTAELAEQAADTIIATVRKLQA